jgi:hypothetical protein
MFSHGKRSIGGKVDSSGVGTNGIEYCGYLYQDARHRTAAKIIEEYICKGRLIDERRKGCAQACPFGNGLPPGR